MLKELSVLVNQGRVIGSLRSTKEGLRQLEKKWFCNYRVDPLVLLYSSSGRRRSFSPCSFPRLGGLRFLAGKLRFAEGKWDQKRLFPNGHQSLASWALMKQAVAMFLVFAPFLLDSIITDLFFQLFSTSTSSCFL